MSITKSHFFNEINHLDEMTEADVLQQSLQEQEQKSKKQVKETPAVEKPKLKLPF